MSHAQSPTVVKTNNALLYCGPLSVEHHVLQICILNGDLYMHWLYILVDKLKQILSSNQLLAHRFYLKIGKHQYQLTAMAYQAQGRV